MTPLRPQHPTRRRIALRPRGDVFTVPTGHPHEPREYVWPTEAYDPDGEARPLDWREFRDGSVWLGGLLVFAGIVVFVVFAGIVW